MKQKKLKVIKNWNTLLSGQYLLRIEICEKVTSFILATGCKNSII